MIDKSMNIRPVSYGTRVAEIQVGPNRRRFTVHEDLLCAYSQALKHLFQKNRKSDDQDCAVCHELLDNPSQDTTYCSVCGQNYHVPCILDCLKLRNVCPVCQSGWVNKKKHPTADFPELDPEIFHTFTQWLYSGQIPIYEGEKRGSDKRYFRLMKARTLSETIASPAFGRAIFATVVQDVNCTNTLPGKISLYYIYNDTAKGSELRKFTVRLFAENVTPDFLDRDDVPDELVRDMARESLKGRKRILQDGIEGHDEKKGKKKIRAGVGSAATPIDIS